MVRAQAKQTPEEKKETKKKASSHVSSSSSIKKKPDTGSWPCKMDGCNKVFAREADLKRHQRTTKMHSIPGFQCPQCDATFTRTDALRRHQKSRHNGVVIEPSEPDKSRHSVDGGSSGSRSPSPGGTPARSVGDGSPNGSPSVGGSRVELSARGPGYYRPHTMQDGYYPGYAPRPPPPGIMVDLHYPPPPMGIPTSATRGNWQPSPTGPPPPPPWGPDGHPMGPPPPGVYMPSYYPPPYYRPPGMPMPPHLSQINPELLAQSNGHSNGVGPPESALRNTSAESPKDRDLKAGASSADSASTGHHQHIGTSPGHRSSPGARGRTQATEEPDESTLMAAVALQAVLAYQKEQEIREAASRATTTSQHDGSPPHVQAQGAASTSARNGTVPQHIAVEQPPDSGPSIVPVQAPKEEDPADLDASGKADLDIPEPESDNAGMPPPSMEPLVTEDGTPMLNPEELLTQESLASPPPS